MDSLTARELEVLRELARTDDRQVAAAKLGITAYTVGVHRYNAYRKLGVSSARQAWIKLGWMRTP